MFKQILLGAVLSICTQTYANNLTFFRNYYPVKPYLYFFNSNLKNVNLVNDGPYGLFEENYSISNTNNEVSISNINGESFIVELKNEQISAIFNDTNGLWQTFKLNYSDDLLDSFIWEYRFMIEGNEEPLMIKEENIFQYEDGVLKFHQNDAKYSSRTFNYRDGRLSEIVNYIGNGETESIIIDKLAYTSPTDYIMEPCTELNFYSLHYPRLSKKIHTEDTKNGVTTITDIYYDGAEVYYKTTQQWDSEKILSLSTYIGLHNNTATFTFNYQ